MPIEPFLTVAKHYISILSCLFSASGMLINNAESNQLVTTLSVSGLSHKDILQTDKKLVCGSVEPYGFPCTLYGPLIRCGASLAPGLWGSGFYYKHVTSRGLTIITANQMMPLVLTVFGYALKCDRRNIRAKGE